jgi:hypothetical protein
MHWATFNSRAINCRTWAWVCPLPPLGSRCPHADWARWYWELLTPSCCGVFFGNAPLLSGSGNLGTPSARMQRANASVFWVLVDWLLPDATSGRARPTVATMAATVRAADGDGRRMKRVPPFLIRQFYCGAGNTSATSDVGPMSHRPVRARSTPACAAPLRRRTVTDFASESLAIRRAPQPRRPRGRLLLSVLQRRARRRWTGGVGRCDGSIVARRPRGRVPPDGEDLTVDREEVRNL